MRAGATLAVNRYRCLVDGHQGSGIRAWICRQYATRDGSAQRPTAEPLSRLRVRLAGSDSRVSQCQGRKRSLHPLTGGKHASTGSRDSHVKDDASGATSPESCWTHYDKERQGRLPSSARVQPLAPSPPRRPAIPEKDRATRSRYVIPPTRSTTAPAVVQDLTRRRRCSTRASYSIATGGRQRNLVVGVRGRGEQKPRAGLSTLRGRGHTPMQLSRRTTSRRP